MDKLKDVNRLNYEQKRYIRCAKKHNKKEGVRVTLEQFLNISSEQIKQLER